MRIIKIDVEKKKITDVLHDGTLENIYRLIGNGCRTFTCPVEFNSLDALYCDDESLLRPDDIKGGFIMNGWSYPIVGNALVIGTDEEGDSRDTHTSMLWFCKNVIFIDEQMAKDYAAEALSKPPIIFIGK